MLGERLTELSSPYADPGDVELSRNLNRRPSSRLLNQGHMNCYGLHEIRQIKKRCAGPTVMHRVKEHVVVLGESGPSDVDHDVILLS